MARYEPSMIPVAREGMRPSLREKGVTVESNETKSKRSLASPARLVCQSSAYSPLTPDNQVQLVNLPSRYAVPSIAALVRFASAEGGQNPFSLSRVSRQELAWHDSERTTATP